LRDNVLVACQVAPDRPRFGRSVRFADIEGLIFGEPKPNIVLRVPEGGRADSARNNLYWQ
jgi:hypothetical protein